MVARHMSKPAHTKWEIEYMPSRGYRLVDPEGRPQPTVYVSRDLVLTALGHAQARTDAARGRKTRPCLCCTKEFDSEGIHNRMCTACRSRNSDGWDPFGLAPKRGRAA